MMRIFKKQHKAHGRVVLTESKTATKDSWIQVVSPTAEEKEFLEEELSIPPELINAALASDSMARIDKDVYDGFSLIILRVPYHGDDMPTATMPLGIIFPAKKNFVVTISAAGLGVIEKIIEKPSKKLYLDSKALFFGLLAKRIFREYFRELNIIENEIDAAEKSMQDSFENKEIILLLALQKTLIYFKTALVGNRAVLNKVYSADLLHAKTLPEKEIFKEVIVDVNEVHQLAETYSQILSNMLAAYTSITSNNFNTILRFLALVTLTVSIPTMIFSFYGMNISLPFQEASYASILVSTIAVVGTLLVLLFFKYRRLV